MDQPFRLKEETCVVRNLLINEEKVESMVNNTDTKYVEKNQSIVKSPDTYHIQPLHTSTLQKSQIDP